MNKKRNSISMSLGVLLAVSTCTPAIKTITKEQIFKGIKTGSYLLGGLYGTKKVYDGLKNLNLVAFNQEELETMLEENLDKSIMFQDTPRTRFLLKSLLSAIGVTETYVGCFIAYIMFRNLLKK